MTSLQKDVEAANASLQKDVEAASSQKDVGKKQSISFGEDETVSFEASLELAQASADVSAAQADVDRSGVQTDEDASASKTDEDRSGAQAEEAARRSSPRGSVESVPDHSLIDQLDVDEQETF